MTRWEYMCTSVLVDDDGGINRLHALCAEGWEPYAVTLRVEDVDRHNENRYQDHHLRRPSLTGMTALFHALREWDALFPSWAEPFEGYPEEKALHRALARVVEAEGKER